MRLRDLSIDGFIQAIALGVEYSGMSLPTRRFQLPSQWNRSRDP